MPKETYLPRLFQLFRDYGYDGATLSKISQATGLGKASLYHHFPGGKAEMVEAVMAYVDRWVEENLLPTLQGTDEAKIRFVRMGDRLMDLYDSGHQPCITAILLSGSARGVFHEQVKLVYQTWKNAIAAVLIETGLAPKQAKERAEDALISIQGSLILSQGLEDSQIFQRVIQQLPTHLSDGR